MSSASSRFQAIFQAALKSYMKQTKTDLLIHPLASQLQSCDSPSAIIAVLEDQVRGFDKSRSADERLTEWLGPTVNVLCAFSAAISEDIGLVFSPANVIFAGIGIFVSAAQGVAASKDLLAELFERIGYFFTRLETYTEVAPTTAMTNIITEIMVEVLRIFGIATKELRRGSAKKFLRKLAGMADLEGALQKLDRLTQEEARIALAEVLRISQHVRDGVRVVDGKVESVGDKVADMGDKVEDIGDEVEEIGNKVEDISDKVEDIGDNMDEVKWNQLKQLLRAWLSPPDPSTNHNIARKAQHKGTAIWFFQGSIFIEWKSTGSLLWVYGKPGAGKSVICSSVIQDVMAICEAGPAIMAYFYFDFKDLHKQTCHDLLLSLVSQLSTRSIPCCDILHRVYKAHKNGTRQPSDDTLKGCLKEMLRLPGQGPIFILLDAIDECPDSSGIPSPRGEVLHLVEELIGLRLQELHIFATSHPAVDIRAVLEPLAFSSVSLHDESGHKIDIANYVRNVVNLSPSMAMKRWRDDDKNLVIETLTETADGMFRWVFCQLETLRHCFPQNLRQFLNELPESLDETYERILRGINKAQKEDARRLLHCLTAAARPLRVEELAELLAFDFWATSERGIPTLKEDWRWNDQEEAVLSTCSSLISIVRNGNSRVVQFSHFSVKEYLTSPRLEQSRGDVSRFHIDLNAAHTILAQACLGTLLQLDEHTGNIGSKGFPLVEYAARHWVEHAQFESVSSRVWDGLVDLFDASKPHFEAWLQVYDMDERWGRFSSSRRDGVGSPLYYAALCGFHDLAGHLIMEHPEQVNARGGRSIAPLPAALSKQHFHVANLLRKHGAVVDVRDEDDWTPLHAASDSGSVDVMRWLLDHGADANVWDHWRQIPLHLAVYEGHHRAVQVLLEHKPDVNSQDYVGGTALYQVSFPRSHSRGREVDIVRLLLDHGADPNIPDNSHSTPLHHASSSGLLDVARLLLSYGANIDEKDKEGKTPLQVASEDGHHEMTKLLLEHGAEPQL